jgi:hypothetical protein
VTGFRHFVVSPRDGSACVPGSYDHSGPLTLSSRRETPGADKWDGNPSKHGLSVRQEPSGADTVGGSAGAPVTPPSAGISNHVIEGRRL